MRHSLIRLVTFSVLACWAVGFVALVLYGRSQTWTENKVRRDGVFLAHELLEQTPENVRAKRLRELQEHFSVDLTLISLEDQEFNGEARFMEYIEDHGCHAGVPMEKMLAAWRVHYGVGERPWPKPSSTRSTAQ